MSATSPEGREDVICRSNARVACEMLASTSSAKRFATVHLYLHPSTQDTTYTGTMRVTFMNGFAPDLHEGTIGTTVRPGDAPFDVSVTGPVTPIPGVYSTNISLVAMSTTEGSPQRIRDVIAVTVK